jgi:hypothetical protein
MIFVKTISTTAKLYRSADTLSNLPSGYWFGFSPSDTFGYGSVTGEFNPTKDLKLLDITNLNFYEDLLQKLKERSIIDPPFNTAKNQILFPIGFTDFDTYHRFAIILGLTPHTLPNDIQLKLESLYFGNRSRCSVKQLDILLMEFLKHAYPMCDGIIAETKLPNLIFNGLHHAEIGIFDPSYVNIVGPVARTIIGGGFPYSSEPKMLIAIDHSHPMIDIAKEYIEKNIKPMREKNINIKYKNISNRKTRKNKLFKIDINS